jgi:hypothetical protein
MKYRKPLVLTEGDWLKIYNSIAKEYPPSVLIIREKMKSVLGFTVRTHRGWVKDPNHDPQYAFGTEYDSRKYEVKIHLDFYNDPKRTMFMLKYGDLISEKA